MQVNVHQGDITKLEIEAIVNAANTSLLGGSGVDGAIHRAAGPELAIYCRNLGGCKVGQAKISPGFKLPAKWVIHTVGPVWNGGHRGEEELLTSCYVRALELAQAKNIHEIAFPCISTGIYKFPQVLAANIAVTTCLGSVRPFDKMTFCCFDNYSASIYANCLKEHWHEQVHFKIAE